MENQINRNVTFEEFQEVRNDLTQTNRRIERVEDAITNINNLVLENIRAVNTRLELMGVSQNITNTHLKNTNRRILEFHNRVKELQNLQMNNL